MKDIISTLLKERKMDLRKDMLPYIELTEAGYYAMFRNDSMKVSTLRNIASFLKVPVSTFFIEKMDKKSIVSESATKGNKDLEIEMLKERVSDLKEINELLKHKIDLLKKVV